MKKLLLASTALVLTAGFAAAEGYTLAANATFGVLNNGTTTDAYSTADATLTWEGMSDNGWTFGTSMDVEVGSMGRDGFAFTAPTGVWGFGGAWVAMNGLTLTFNQGNIDDLYDSGNGGHDLSAAYAGNALNAEITVDVDGTAAASFSYDLGYDMNGFSVGVTGDDIAGNTSFTLGYASGPVSVDVTADQGTGVNSVAIEYVVGDVTLGLGADDAGAWDVSADVTSGDLSASVTFDSTNAWEATGAMAMGGGLSLVAGVNSASAWYLGGELGF